MKTRSDTNTATGSSATGTTGTHHRAPAAPPEGAPAPYEPHLDGLFTYCLSVLCDHDEAAAALADTLALARRHRSRLRDRSLTRPWLYALARHACLHRLASRKAGAGEEAERQGREQARGKRAKPRGRTEGGGPGGAGPAPEALARPLPAQPTGSPLPPETALGRRRELAALAWPEAAGIEPDQREALELAVRHGLTAEEVGAVLRLEPDQARALLARAACEVERTRAALAAAEAGGCRTLATLAGDSQVLLSRALRTELVRHADECRTCRTAAERAMASEPWPGMRTPAVLPVIPAPGPRRLAEGEKAAARLNPRFDRRGFPVGTESRATRRARLRRQAVTVTVAAAVVAVPVLALWAAYHGGQEDIASHEGPGPVSESAPDGTVFTGEGPGDGTGTADRGHHRDGRASGAPTGAVWGEPGTGTGVEPDGGAPPWAVEYGEPGLSEPTSAPSLSYPGPHRPGGPAPGRLSVEARPQGEDVVVTLSASGETAVRWSASASAPWLVLSRSSGVLQPGESTTVTVRVDRSREPEGPWTERVTFTPSGASITVQGEGRTPSPSQEPPGTPPADDPPAGDPSRPPEESPAG